jgi:RNA polymerase sigma-70 factor (ECF subfamily)
MVRKGAVEAVGNKRLRDEFARMIEPFDHTLFAGALRLTNNTSDAEDLLQETYMRGYVGYTRAQEIDQPRAWLFKIMTNAYINRYHKKRRRGSTVSYEQTLDHKLDSFYAPKNEDPQERFFAQFLDSEVRDAVESLPEHFRRSVILCDVSGLSYNEISEVLDCSLGTVRSRISRGREILFHKLFDYATKRGVFNRGAGNRRGRPRSVSRS